MSKKKIYAIKRRNYEFNDNFYEFGEDDPPLEEFGTNYEWMQKRLIQLEVEKCRLETNFGLGIDLFIGDYFEDNLGDDTDKLIPKIKIWYKDNFGIDFYSSKSSRGTTPSMVMVIPKEATFDQINEIRKLLKINFYSLYEYDFVEDMKKYSVEFSENFFPKSFNSTFNNETIDLGYLKVFQIKKTFFDKEESLDYASKAFLEFLYEYNDLGVRDLPIPGFKGSIEELSSSPAILKSTLESNDFFKYSDEVESIVINSEIPLYKGSLTKEFLILNQLLKNKPIKIIEEKIKSA